MAKKRQNEEIITPLTQLEKRQFQTRTYPAQDNVIAMKAILNVLQDEGYIVYNVNSLLGYIYGIKDFDLSDPNIDITKEFNMTKSRLNYNGVKVATIEAGINITQYGNKSRIRANFKRKLLNQYGNAQMIDDVSDIEFYDDFYTKVDSAINLQKEIAQKINKPAPAAAKPVSGRNAGKSKTAKPAVVPNTQSEISEDEKNINNPETAIENSAEKPKNETEVKDAAIETENTDVTENNKKNNTKQNVSEEITKPEPPEISEKQKTNEEEFQTTQDIKEIIKQAKEEAKQAEKEAKQAAKEARKAEKEAIKQAKQQAKETEE